jgi:hypothetical protein
MLINDRIQLDKNPILQLALDNGKKKKLGK